MKKRSKKRLIKKKIDKSKVLGYDYHLPVLLNEATDYLINEKIIDTSSSIYIDGTLGGGGHADIIMQKIKQRGILFAFDKDKTAIELAKIKFEEEISSSPPKLLLFNQSFSFVKSIFEKLGKTANGILLDLGVSSNQLDSGHWGISYRVDAPLNMRFDSTNINEDSEYYANNSFNAKDLLNFASEDELAEIFLKYGEDPRSRVVARRIVEFRRAKTLETTFKLKQIIEECTPKHLHFKTLSRIFQAIRIKVNNELDELTNVLEHCLTILKPGSRIVVISYHSLEDRIVKQFFKDNSFKTKINKYQNNNEIENIYENNINKELPIVTSNIVPNISNIQNKKKLILLTPKPIIPSETEIIRNPRARSAKMRVAELV